MGSELGAVNRRGAARLVRRHRRLLAGAAVAASITMMGLALQPPAGSTRAVVVAAGDLPTGRALVPGDLTVAEVNAGVLPVGTFGQSETILGRVLAAPVVRGEAVAEHRLMAPPAWSVPAGTMPVPVRFADQGAAELLTAGQRIDVLAASGPSLDDGARFASAELVADAVLVLAVITPDAQAQGSLGPSPMSPDGSALVVLAAGRSSALAIAGAQARASLGYVMHPSAG